MSHKRTILTNRQWAALVRLWQAGPEGIDREVLRYGPGGFTWQPTLSRLVYHTPEPLIEYFRPTPIPYKGSYRITEAGCIFYRDHWLQYCELYPSVDAPEPIDE